MSPLRVRFGVPCPPFMLSATITRPQTLSPDPWATYRAALLGGVAPADWQVMHPWVVDVPHRKPAGQIVSYRMK